MEIATILDKLDKVGAETVVEELGSIDLSVESIDTIMSFIGISKLSNQDKLLILKDKLKTSNVGLEGIAELEDLFKYLEIFLPLSSDGFNIILDPCLARGLDYYTGIIFELKAKDAQIGSIASGGRYDNLTEIFNMPGMSGVGISFGADRLYDVMSELNLFPANIQKFTTQVLFVTLEKEDLLYALNWAKILRKRGVCLEVYPGPSKIKKQLSYANDRQIPYVAIVGSNERESGKVLLRDMKTGDQRLVTLDELLEVCIQK